MKNKSLFVIMSLLLIVSIILTGCGKTEEPAAVEEAPAAEEAVAEEEAVEEAVVEETAEPTTFSWAIQTDPDTLDPHKTGAAVSDYVMSFIGSSLVALDTDGSYKPYLAKSWEISEDGLTYTFTLRDDVLFQDGTSLTAGDLAFTYNRALDPETASPSAGPMLGPVASIQALDDYTLEFVLETPFFPFLYGLTSAGYLMPLSQAYVEANGDDYIARNPMSVGPYKMSEWVTGEYVLLEKNPDFNWGPETWGNTGPWHIDYIKFPIIPEQSTTVAGVEAGEIDLSPVEAKDLELFQSDSFDILEQPQQGLRPYIALQTTSAPLDDINVRKALNMAINREAVLQLLEQGNGVVQYGPLSPSQIGYWPGVEEYGYPYNPDEAKALLEGAGYTMNADGYYEKDGEILAFTLFTLPVESWVKAAEVAQSMFKDIGVEITIQQEEQGVVIPKILGGEYQISMFGMTYPEADVLYLMFHSSQIGGFNYAFVNNPELDAILDRTRSETDPAARQEAVNEAQKFIAEQAYTLPLYAPINFWVLNSRVKNYVFNPTIGFILADAYIE